MVPFDAMNRRYSYMVSLGPIVWFHCFDAGSVLYILLLSDGGVFDMVLTLFSGMWLCDSLIIRPGI